MGLDMYLERIHKDVVGYMDIDVNKLNPDDDLYNKLKPYMVTHGNPGYYTWKSLLEEVGYWRKANEIHNWFVNKVQCGIDDCKEYEVSKDDLEELLDTCNEVLSKAVMVNGKIVNGYTLSADLGEQPIYEEGKYVVNPEVCAEYLPTVDGFFFGSTDYDQYYISDVADTVKILEKVLSETNFNTHKIYYYASW